MFVKLGSAIANIGLVLELAILLRAAATGMYKRFPIFYAYMFCVFAGSLVLAKVYPGYFSNTYTRLFWANEFFTMLLGYGVVLEITHHAFRDYPGAERLARNAGFAAFGIIFLWYAIAAKIHKLPIDFDHGMPLLGGIARDLRIVEGIFLFIVAAVVLHYGIELGKNVRGLALGMGIYVAVCIVVMALMVVFKSIDTHFGIIASGTYILTTCIWMVSMWSYADVRVPQQVPKAATDYEDMAQRTREKLKALRSNFPTAGGQ